MPISLTCDCGRVLRVKDTSAGKKVRCPTCKVVLNIPAPAESTEEDQALTFLLDDSSSSSQPTSPPPPERAITPEPRERRPAPVMPTPRPSRSKPAPWIEKATRDVQEKSGPSWWDRVDGRKVISGGLMMLGAAVWFFLG